MNPMLNKILRLKPIFSSLDANNILIGKSTAASRYISTCEKVLCSRKLNHVQRMDFLNGNVIINQQFRNTSRVTTNDQNRAVRQTATPSLLTPNDIREFDAILPELVQELTDCVNNYTGEETANWFKRALEYNLKRSVKYRSLLVPLAYKTFAKEITADNMRLAHIIGWCLDMCQQSLIIYDDIIDKCDYRRKQLCWHKVDGVGLIAINDAVMIEQGAYYLLNKHLGHLECYRDVFDLFHEMTFSMLCGLSFDSLCEKISVESYTRDKYRNLATHKSGLYSYYMPIAAGMHLAGCKDVQVYEELKPMLLELSIIFAAYDDVMDSFSEGHNGNDIRQHKCTWLAVECMQRANKAQKAIMLECYGKDDPEMVNRVKQVYYDMKLDDAYAKFEDETFNKVRQKLKQASKGVPKELISEIMNNTLRKFALSL